MYALEFFVSAFRPGKSPERKRSMRPIRQYPQAPGAVMTMQGIDPLGANDIRKTRHIMEQILVELRTLNANIALTLGDGRTLMDADSVSISAQEFN